MSEMKVVNLNVDLLQDQATVALIKQPAPQTVPGKPNFTAINVNVPISTPGNQPENRLKQIAIEQAKKALKEAIQTLEAHPV
jgi:uncharacterized membrane protein